MFSYCFFVVTTHDELVSHLVGILIPCSPHPSFPESVEVFEFVNLLFLVLLLLSFGISFIVNILSVFIFMEYFLLTAGIDK